MTLKGKSALITGSTSGIGLGFARALAAEGVHIMLNGLGDAGEIEKTRAALAKETGVTVLYSPANMMKGGEITAMVGEAVKAFGGVDILINNAGIQHVAPIDEFPDDKWEAIIRINLVAAFYAIKAALPSMKARGWGRIINLSSAHALVASPYKSAYVAAKHGISGLTKTVALEVAQQKITVNAIAPGYFATELNTALLQDEAFTKWVEGRTPLGRWAKPEELGGAVVFLASDAASYVNGHVLAVDGGLSVSI